MKKWKIPEEKTPFGKLKLYEKASIKKVIEHLKAELDWSVIKVVPETPFDNINFANEPLPYSIKEIIAPNISKDQFLPYAIDLDKTIDTRLKKLIRNKGLLKEEKIKLLIFCKRICLEQEVRYNPNNLFHFAINFYWRIKNSRNGYSGITYNYLNFSEIQHKYFYEQFLVRHQFFQWIRLKIEDYIIQLESMELYDPVVIWEKSNHKIKIAELVYAMEEAGEIKFKKLEDKRLFYSYCERIFNLGKCNWADLESDIRKRKKEKWAFIRMLSDSLR